MGCNTSKESVPQESENKENPDEGSATENKNPGNENAEKSMENSAENHTNELNDTKSPSAKTITLRPKSTTSVRSTKSTTSNKESNKQIDRNSASSPKNLENAEDPKDEEEAATKIQAAFRGHQTRKSMKQPAGKEAQAQQRQQEEASSRAALEEEFRADDRELCDAATKIQASFRGHMTRKHEAEKKNEPQSSAEKNQQNTEEELDIDLSDPDLNKAAVKIQASFRGHMVRKDNEGDKPTDVSN